MVGEGCFELSVYLRILNLVSCGENQAFNVVYMSMWCF